MNKNIIALLLIILIGTSLFVYQRNGEKSLIKNKLIASALITKIELTKRPVVPRIHYEILDRKFNELYFEDIKSDFNYKKIQLLKGNVVNIIIDTTNTNVQRLLLSDDDYRKYGVNRPDSMQWLKQMLGR